MIHQIPPHLVFCTPGQNQEVKQGTNLDIKESDITKTNRKINRQAKQTDLHILNEFWMRKGQASFTHKELKKQDTYESSSRYFKTYQENQLVLEVNQKQQDLTICTVSLYLSSVQVTEYIYINSHNTNERQATIRLGKPLKSISNAHAYKDHKVFQGYNGLRSRQKMRCGISGYNQRNQRSNGE